MSSKAHADRLSRAIEQTGLAQPVNSAHAENRVNVLCRVAQGYEGRWTDLIRRLLLATEVEQGEAYSWQAHICRHYFLKEIDGEKKLVFGWNISIQSQDMSTSLDFLMRILKGEAPRVRPPEEDEEMPLTGLTKDRNVPKHTKDRGSFTIGGKNDFRASGARK